MRYGDGWLGAMHSMDELKMIIADIKRQRREYGRDQQNFDILVQCPEANTVDDIRRLEDIGVTDLWIVPWAYYGARAKQQLAEGEVPTMFNAQPSLEKKVDAIKRYGDEIISKF